MHFEWFDDKHSICEENESLLLNSNSTHPTGVYKRPPIKQRLYPCSMSR